MSMNGDNERITPYQSVAFLISVIIGTGVLSMPGDVAKSSGPDSWICVILGGFFSFLFSLPIAYIIKYMDEKSFSEYLINLAGRFLGTIITLLYSVYCFLISVSTLQVFANVLCTYIFRETPKAFVIILMLLLTVYLTISGVKPTVETSYVLLPVLIFSMILIYAATLHKADFTEFLPFLNSSFKDIVLGTYNTLYSYLGFELLLVIAPSLKNRDSGKFIFKNTFSILIPIYLYVVVLVISSLGLEQTKQCIWPSMTLMMSISGPGRIFERLGIVAMVVWILTSFTTLTGFYLGGALTFSGLWGLKNYRTVVIIAAPIVYILSLLPSNAFQTINFIKVLNYLGIACSIAIPICLSIAESLRSYSRHIKK